MSKNILGMEIGSNSTKIIYGLFEDEKFKVEQYKKLDFDISEDPDKSINEINKVVKEFKAAKAPTYITINHGKTIIRIRELPYVKPKELEDIVSYEAEQFSPYTLDKFYIDYRVLDTVQDQDNPKLETMIVVVPREVIDQYIHIIDETKLKVKNIDVYTNALFNYASKYYLNKEEDILFIDINKLDMNMTIFQKDKYFANIHSRKGINDFIENIQLTKDFDEEEIHEYLYFDKNKIDKEDIKETKEELEQKIDQLSEEESDGIEKLENLKKQIKLLDEEEYIINDEERTNQLYNLYDIIGNEIKRTLDFYISREYNANINHIVLIGEGSRLYKLKKYIQETFNIDVVNLYVEEHDGIAHEHSNILIPVVGGLLR